MNAQKGFTLIELMIVIAIIGILAAIAIPAYTDYTARAKITEAVAALASAKTSVSEYYTSQGVMPADAAAAGINTSPAGSYVDSISYDKTSDTVAVVTAKVKGVNDTANTKTFQLTGTGADNGITWVCAPGATDPIDKKYLPANCR
ncbi:pilin [Psychrobacter pacificensis]|uniref:pilin n=1 Tax=Psychrobacter pacificensis TaxID=112002 RepID=UPI0028C3D968|nr:pilin [Psychrobacter pacificensis]